MIGLFLYFILSYVIGIAGIFSIIRITLNYLNVFGFSSTVLSIFVYVMAFISLIQVLLSFKKALKSFWRHYEGCEKYVDIYSRKF